MDFPKKKKDFWDYERESTIEYHETGKWCSKKIRLIRSSNEAISGVKIKCEDISTTELDAYWSSPSTRIVLKQEKG